LILSIIYETRHFPIYGFFCGCIEWRVLLCYSVNKTAKKRGPAPPALWAFFRGYFTQKAQPRRAKQPRRNRSFNFINHLQNPSFTLYIGRALIARKNQ